MMKNILSALVVVFFACAGCKNEASEGSAAKGEAVVASASVKPIASGPPPVESAAPLASAAPPAMSASAASPPPAAPLELTAKSSDDDVAAVGQRVVALLEASVTMLNASEGDCAKIAAGYDKVLADNPTVIEEIKSFASKRPVKKRIERWLESHSGDLMTRVGKTSALVTKCKKDKDFKEASQRFLKALRGR